MNSRVDHRPARRRLLLCLPGLAAATGIRAAAPRRRVSLGGTVTEIVFALGAGDQLVGVDQSSFHPEAASRLPKVGYYRGFSVEGVAALRPDLVLASDQAGPPRALAQLRQLGNEVITVPSAPKVEALLAAIDVIAQALEQVARGRELAGEVSAGVALAGRRSAAAPVRVLLLSSHTGKLQAAGRETAADALLALAGAANVFSSQSGYKAISAEAVAAMQPDVIVTTTLSLRSIGSLAEFVAQPGIAVTPAARNRRVVVMDDLLLLGFGPRLPQALRELQDGLSAGPALPRHS